MGNRRAREFMRQQVEEADWERVRTEPRPASRDVHARDIGQRRLQLIVAPSFEPASAWEVRQGREWQLFQPRVVETWPEVMLVGYAPIAFASAALAGYFERVVSLSLPLRPDLSGCSGCDGTLQELAVFADMQSAWRFQWWSRGPEQWQPLVELATEMHVAFVAARGPDE